MQHNSVGVFYLVHNYPLLRYDDSRFTFYDFAYLPCMVLGIGWQHRAGVTWFLREPGFNIPAVPVQNLISLLGDSSRHCFSTSHVKVVKRYTRPDAKLIFLQNTLLSFPFQENFFHVTFLSCIYGRKT